MNKSNSLLEKMRQDALHIFNQSLIAVDPKTCIYRCCRLEGNRLYVNDHSFDLDAYDQIRVIGAGKAAASMAYAVEQLLGDRISRGLVIVKYDHLEPLNTIKIVEAAHPVPDENGVAGSKQLLDMARSADETTLVICLVSGGGSALMVSPADGLTLKDKQETTRVLLSCGATIHEMNTIRKHLSAIKGGQLASAVYPATMVCLILSDVVGDDLDIISSGPAVADPGTFESCMKIIQNYGIEDRLPGAVISHLKRGAQGLIPETPKPGDRALESVYHTIVANNFDALKTAEECAEKLGYNTLILSSVIEGETADIAGMHAAVARQVLMSGHPIRTPACILSGGETTVTIKGKGKGGRNQEFALASAFHIDGKKRIVILSGGTDGSDGPTDAAGAMADHTTIQRAVSGGLNPERHLKENNAYPFFDGLNDLVKTGATNTNVMDVRIMLIR